MKEIGFTSAAARQWRKLTADTRAQIDLKLAVFAETGAGDVKALKGVTGMRLRAGDWRVLFTIKRRHHHNSRGRTPSRHL